MRPGRPRLDEELERDIENIIMWRLKEAEGKTAAEIAEMYGVHTSTAWRRIQKARQSMKDRDKMGHTERELRNMVERQRVDLAAKDARIAELEGFTEAVLSEMLQGAIDDNADSMSAEEFGEWLKKQTAKVFCE